MARRSELFGVIENVPVYRHILENRDGTEAAFIDYGARVQSIRTADRAGTIEEVTLGFDTIDRYMSDRDYLGATIGRCANRIDRGRFSIADRRYQLDLNNGPHHLHGGTEGFHRRLWRYEESAGSSSTVAFSLVSHDGDQGYPGELTVQVAYTLTELSELHIEFTAATSARTPVNLTNHCYWNLNNSHDGTILDHQLQLDCSAYLPVDSTLIPTGEIRSVENTPMAFLRPTDIGSRFELVQGGYDHCYLRDYDGENSVSAEPVRIATLTSGASGRVLEIATTKSATQFYTGNFLDGLIGRGGAPYRRYAGLCLEPQYPPDSINQGFCPEITLVPEQVYRHHIVLRFLTVQDKEG